MRSNSDIGNTRIALIIFSALIAYLIMGTGMVSDDLILTLTMKGESVVKSIDPRLCLHTPLENIFFFFWYPLFSFDNTLLVEIVKILYVLLSFYMVSKFFGIFLDVKYAILASFLFIFFPSHDSTVYWFLGQYIALSMAFYLFAYYLAHRNRLIAAFIMALAASFLSYGSTAVAAPLFLLFILKKDVRKGLTIFMPNIIYIAYYFFVIRLMPGAINRFSADINILSFIRQLALQVVTFCDATLGPSMWLKICSSISQLSILSVLIGVAIMYLFIRSFKEKAAGRYDPKLVASLIVMALVSFALFAMTGAYPQLAFNLGNRATIFGSLLIVYLIIGLPAPRGFKIVVLSVVIFSILGISDHWKAWSVRQKAIFTEMKYNPGLQALKDGQVIFISGNQYSKLGPFSHIEFFSEGGPDCAVNYALGKQLSIRPINGRFNYSDGYIIDTKYGDSLEVKDSILVYDSEKNSLFRLKKEGINDYIASLPPDIRHWTQLPAFEPLRKAAVLLMPRLKYAL